MAQENKARSGHLAAYSTSPFPAHGSGACVTTMVRWCDQVRVRHVRWPRCGRGDLREKGDDPDLHLGAAHDRSVREMQERLAEMERSEKEQSAETARRRHWNPNCSRKWRPSRMCTRAGCWTRMLPRDERDRSVERSPIPSTRSRKPIAVCVDSGYQRREGAHRCW